jgi:diadenosine tetraphosphatase ApaH/serine/threonine PP2A family protein phosphatase
MRVLVVSDIHGNLAALQAVLEDARQYEYEEVWCLGDIVGYGPEPNECIAQIRLLNATAVVGNHDWAAIERMDIDDFNSEARRAVVWTRSQLTAENLAWLSDLPSTPLVKGAFTLTHGSPRDPVWEYILYPATARANFDYFNTPYCLVGHTHVPALHLWQEGESTVRAISPTPGEALLLGPANPKTGAALRVILNPGSVGQPRDNDPRAAYAILDTDEPLWLPCRTAYPIEVTQAHMRAANLPDRLINRLSFGW